MEGLGATRGRVLQVFGFEASVFGNACQHAWTEFFTFVEGEHKVGPTFARQGAMRAGLALHLPAQLEECREDALGL